MIETRKLAAIHAEGVKVNSRGQRPRTVGEQGC